jgi:hypothetical protein
MPFRNMDFWSLDQDGTSYGVTFTAFCAPKRDSCKMIYPREGYSMSLILLVILLVILLGALPAWPYSRSWGYYPSGALGTIVLILVVLLLLGRI